MHESIYRKIQKVAGNREVVYYSDIAPLADLDMSLDRDREEIGRLLGGISRHEHEEGRPLLSAVVVHKPDQQSDESLGPGRGFFTLARELRLMAPDEDEDDFWQRELQRVHDYWGS